MFPAARCVLPVHLRPHATAPFRRAPALTSVSVRARRGGRRHRPSWEDGSDDDDDRIDDSFFGDGARDDESEDDGEEPTGPAERQRRPASPAPEPAGQLRGSDVLRALQRAAAAKEAKKKKTSAGARPRQEKKGSSDAKVKEAAEVTPIEIRPEWAARIRELELRVQHLLHKYHHHG